MSSSVCGFENIGGSCVCLDRLCLRLSQNSQNQGRCGARHRRIKKCRIAGACAAAPMALKPDLKSAWLNRVELLNMLDLRFYVELLLSV